ncbi:hypothetical protein DI396_08000 [Litorivita pollutaquae]|uniref:Aldehyde oxidase/xanthine dehydrogenase a/b hammerhead domain-containing protein n=1 Tax=Litorivita pollutaquae TaxID=2200892 RepID=A0A2V4MZK5_9RHOB|nr:xanthine dehydrogenase family protein molybdopterin-binding subunit [Litorivita pollutaquae]PYC48014.1 hypothetical protein DI396_08000 [Litorivita pollutaquae]
MIDANQQGDAGRGPKRREDVRLLRGQGRYTDDLTAQMKGHGPEPGQAQGELVAVFLRAPVASARITHLDPSAAMDVAGVRAVLTGADLVADGVGPVQTPMEVTGPDGTVYGANPRPLLATDTVRHLGEPVAIVLAETLHAAMDGAEAVEVDYDDLPVVTDPVAALDGAAALVHDTCPGNLSFEWQRGDVAAVEASLTQAAHVVRLKTHISRVTAVAMEPRTARAAPWGESGIAITASVQNMPVLRGALIGAFGMAPEEVRVIAPDVGGAFGMKAGPLREEMLVFWAAKKMGCAVAWRADRSESFLSDEAGRDWHVEAALGLDADGNFTALHADVVFNCGAYGSLRSMIMVTNMGGIAGMYRTPVVAARVRGALTHTVPTAPYRGAGRPEATLIIEQLIDKAAQETGRDPVDLRRQNLIQPEQMPWASPFIFDYDSGDFPAVLEAGLARADVGGYAARRAASEAAGRIRGFGLALCVETAGGIYGNPGQDCVEVVLEGDGTLRLAIGAFDAGQGLETALSELAAAALQVSSERIRFLQGDSDVLAAGKGMGGSSGLIQGGAAVLDGAEKFIAQARDLAAEEMEVAAQDVVYQEGVFRIAGTDRALDLSALASIAAARGVTLIGAGGFAPEAPTFPNGCHICEVELDPDTGQIRFDRYACVEDIGRVMYPAMAEGQVMGGVAQGLGQVLCEELHYDRDGQLLSGSFMDYAMPRARDLPFYQCDFAATDTAMNPLSVKGVGEAGTVGAMAAGFSAVRDALAQCGVTEFEMPASPGRVWQALADARG